MTTRSLAYRQFITSEKKWVVTTVDKVQVSTGLHDINDKEIFEGDIIKAQANENYPDDSGIKEVMFNEQELAFQLRESGYSGGLPLTWGGWESLEIIGNIIDNPELRPELSRRMKEEQQ